jgi:hypothetical protein
MMIKRKTIPVALSLLLCQIRPSYKVEPEKTPVIIDISGESRTAELTALSNRFSDKKISGLYFLDSNSFIFSAQNGEKNIRDENPCYDLYRYNLKSEKLTRICTGFELRDSSITVRSAENFTCIKTAII